MPNRNSPNMEPQAIIDEINVLRDGIERSARRIHDLSRILHQQMRRSSLRTGAQTQSRDNAVYVTFANVWTRFGGMVLQGLQRTRQADRVLGMLQKEEEQAERPQEEAQLPQEETQQNQPDVPPPGPGFYDDLITVYGEEIVSDAGRQQR